MIKSKYFLIISLLIHGSTNFCMETTPMEISTDSETSVMQKIDNYKEIESFAGHVVAYTITSELFHPDQSPFNEKTYLLYAYIDATCNDGKGGFSDDPEFIIKNPEPGFMMYQLIKQTRKRCPKGFAQESDLQFRIKLSNEKIKNNSLYMRLITAEEAKQIYTVLESDTATFAYKYTHQADELTLVKTP